MTKRTEQTCRSAITGRFVTAAYAKRYPHLTVCETKKKRAKRK